MAITEHFRRESARSLLSRALIDFQPVEQKIILYPWRCYTLDDEVAEIIRQYLRDKFPEVDTHAVDDFRQRNGVRAPLVDVFGDLSWPQSESAEHAIMVSAPGFSSSGKDAIISVGQQAERLHGVGGCYLYSSDGLRWRRVAELTSWIS